MAPVSVYRVGAVGADPRARVRGEAHDFDLYHAVWLGWLPLELIEFVGPGVALAGDTWLTAPSGRSEGPGHVAAGDIVTVRDAAGELIAPRGARADRVHEPFWGCLAGRTAVCVLGLPVGCRRLGGEHRSAPQRSGGLGRVP